jgi:hypothetical protein
VLFVYYTYSRQALRVVEAMAAVFRDRGAEVHRAAIEFTDPRYAQRFRAFPLRHAFLDVLAMLVPQLRRATGRFRVPEEARRGDYDLVCIGSPTWWLTTCMPVRSFLKSADAHRLLDGKPFAGFVVCRRYWRNNLETVKRLGTEQGGICLDGIHFAYPGNQLRSLLSLVSFLGSGTYRERYLGIKIPPTNLQPYQLEEARAFANGLADRLHLPAAPAASR